MPQSIQNDEKTTGSSRASNTALIVLLLAMSLGLAIWLLWGMRKKEMRKRGNPENSTPITGAVNQLPQRVMCIRFHISTP